MKTQTLLGFVIQVQGSNQPPPKAFSLGVITGFWKTKIPEWHKRGKGNVNDRPSLLDDVFK
jgi:hypothetical protein